MQQLEKEHTHSFHRLTVAILDMDWMKRKKIIMSWDIGVLWLLGLKRFVFSKGGDKKDKREKREEEGEKEEEEKDKTKKVSG